ncbi:hypothetical protein CLPU_17c00640 [Gottschalkia purinilytica]|uniref:Uncharacterized protein n=1 Tax=Gottschalkia purinilytica TaxID=1503 RepID=A0A0L0W7E5_GOTPU|nr:hypothetical protein [Gottschalkia purinilytica]KNF07439.1 hypothetical protein CLPU_17c00640 [Gottschalkia purinilytica]
MIQIDDAGSGSLIGGTCIGAIRVETEEYYYEIIPLEFYSIENFNKKLYLDYVVDIIKKLLYKLKADKNEPIYICRGYMFDKARKWLLDKNYNFESVKIVEPLQSKIEKSFEEYSISLGLFETFIRYTKYPFHFHRILKWVYADYENRSNLCKAGWKSWQKYGNLQTKSSESFLKKSNYICLKCGKAIADNSKVKIISYYSDRCNSVYLHHKC